jgi:hypothetical protein
MVLRVAEGGPAAWHGASAGTKASSSATPERAIAALKQSSWRCIAAVPLDLIGPLTMMRSRVGGRGRSPGMQAMKIPRPAAALRENRPFSVK